jgi:hypothetical protein
MTFTGPRAGITTTVPAGSVRQDSTVGQYRR